MKTKKPDTSFCLLAALILSASGALAAETADAAPKHQLSRPDDKPADQTKKVKVFILMGQSNMVGMGDINPPEKPGTLTTLTKVEKKYPFLLDDAGQWTVRKTVDSRDLWREADVSPKNQGYHYNRNAETYMEVCLRLGWAMSHLLGEKK